MTNLRPSEFKFASVPYRQSLNKELIKAVGFGIAAFTLGGIISGEWVYSLPIGILVFGAFYLKARNWYKNNIEYFSIERNSVRLNYTDQGAQKEIQTDVSNIKVVKKLGISQGRVPYLRISFSDRNESITQYEIGDWDEAKMNEVIQALGQKS